MSYRGRYKIKNKLKYIGDVSNCIYRSSWERALMWFCDTNPRIKKWNVEGVKIPYVCATDQKVHMYIVDFLIQSKNGDWFLIEVKPEKQTRPPRQSKNKRRFLKESLTYNKNQSKWKFAEEYARKRGWKFKVWTEKKLKSMGLPIV